MKKSAPYLFVVLSALAMLLPCCTCSAQVVLPIIRNIEPGDYVSDQYASSARNFGIIQDDFGVMYIANNSGVLTFDGSNWSSVNGTEGLKMFKFAKDEKGRIYTGGFGEVGYISSSDCGEYEYVSMKDLLPDSLKNFDRVVRVMSLGNDIFFMSGQFLLKWDGEKFESWQSKSSFRRLFVDKGRVFVNSRESLFELKKSEMVKVARSGVLDSMDIRGLFVLDEQGQDLLIVSRRSGIFKFYESELFTLNPRLDTVGVFNGLRLNEDSIALGTDGKGLYIINVKSEILEIVDQSAGLQNSQVVFPYQDREGKIWVALNSGISRIEIPSSISLVNKFSGLNSIVTSVLSNQSGKALATTTGVYWLEQDMDKVALEQLRKFNVKTAEVWKIWDVSTGVLAACYNGLFHIDMNGNFLQLSEHKTITAAFRSRVDTTKFYFGLNDNSLHCCTYKGGKWKDDHKIADLQHPIYWIEESSHGDIWVSYRNITLVTKLPENDSAYSVKELSENEGFLDGMEYIHLAKIQEDIVFGTQQGLFVYDYNQGSLVRDKRFPIDFSNGRRMAYNLTETSSGDVWVTTDGQTGVLRMQPDDSYIYDSLPIIRAPITDVYSISESGAGVMWFGGTEALVRYDPTVRGGYDLPFYAKVATVRSKYTSSDSVIFSGSYADEGDYPLLTQPPDYVKEIRYEGNSLEFSFAAPFFDYPEKIEYRYQLGGLESEWSRWTDENEKEYKGLWEGEYTFKVQARNVYGTLSETAEYRFIILPPWYRTIWAYISYGAILLLLMFLSAYVYSRRLVKAKKRLEGIVEERTEEIRSQKDEIEEQALELQEANQELVRLGEFKQSLTSMIVHDLKNPLNALINASEQPEIERQSSMIQQSGRQMLGMVMDILDVHKFEDAQMELDQKPVLCVSITTTALEQVKFLAEQKGVRLWQETPAELATNSDREILVRVLVNLLTNAIKFTPSGGDVLVKVKEYENEMVRFEVIDNGPGIAPEFVEKVFSKFGQVTARKSGGVKSTGLGLTFCKMAVEAHGGQIDLETEVGKGTAFWFTVPSSPSAGLSVSEEPVQAREMTESQKDLGLSAEDRAVLLPVVKEIEELPLYKATVIRKALKAVDDTDSDAVKAWIAAVKNAVGHMNEQKFIELIQQVNPQD